MNLKDKVVLITGSSRGIGAAIAEAMGKKGAKVVVNYRNDKNRAEETAKRIESESLIIKADVSRHEDVKQLFKKAYDHYGKIDILVNNASITLPKEFLESDEEHWKKQFDVTFFGSVWCSLEAAKLMQKNSVAYIADWVKIYLAPLAKKLDITIGQLVVAWTLKQDLIDWLIVGTTNPKQLLVNLNANNVELDAETMDEIESAYQKLVNEVEKNNGMSLREFRGLNEKFY